MARDRGMSKWQCTKFIFPTPLFSEMKCAFVSFMKITFISMEQQKFSIPMTRTILKYFIWRDQYETRTELLSLETGVISSERVNVYSAKEFGILTLKKMVGENVLNYSYWKEIYGSRNEIKIICYNKQSSCSNW